MPPDAVVAELAIALCDVLESAYRRHLTKEAAPDPGATPVDTVTSTPTHTNEDA